MEKFDYKVLWNKRHGLREDWFDGDKNIGPEINTDLLSGYGKEGWEVVAAMQMVYGPTHKIILSVAGLQRSHPRSSAFEGVHIQGSMVFIFK